MKRLNFPARRNSGIKALAGLEGWLAENVDPR
jgi:hypothetical protein